MADTQERQRWQLAVATFSCPFCGREKDKQCVALGAEFPPLAGRDLIAPHQPRLDLLNEFDFATRTGGRGFA